MLTTIPHSTSVERKKSPSGKIELFPAPTATFHIKNHTANLSGFLRFPEQAYQLCTYSKYWGKEDLMEENDPGCIDALKQTITWLQNTFITLDDLKTDLIIALHEIIVTHIKTHRPLQSFRPCENQCEALDALHQGLRTKDAHGDCPPFVWNCSDNRTSTIDDLMAGLSANDFYRSLGWKIIESEVIQYCNVQFIEEKLRLALREFQNAAKLFDAHTSAITAIITLIKKITIIHPFSDCNTRVAILIGQFLFEKYGLPPMMIFSDYQIDYLSVAELCEHYYATAPIQLARLRNVACDVSIAALTDILMNHNLEDSSSIQAIKTKGEKVLITLGYQLLQLEIDHIPINYRGFFEKFTKHIQSVSEELQQVRPSSSVEHFSWSNIDEKTGKNRGLREFIGEQSALHQQYNLLQTKSNADLYASLQNDPCSLLKDSKDIGIVFQHLDKEQIAGLLATFNNHWIDYLKNVTDYQNTFEDLDHEKRLIVSDALLQILPDLIQNAYTFYGLSLYLTTTQKINAVERLQDHWLKIITSLDDFGTASSHLDEAQIVFIFNQIKEKRVLLIKNSFFQYPDEKVSPIIFRLLLKERMIMSLIKQGMSFSYFANLFTMMPDFNVYLFLKCDPTGLLKDAKDVNEAFSFLNAEQRMTILVRLRNRLPIMINDVRDYMMFAKHLQSSQKTELFLWVQDHFLKSILTSGGFYRALEYLDPSTIALLCHQLGKKIIMLMTGMRRMHDNFFWRDSGLQFYNLEFVCQYLIDKHMLLDLIKGGFRLSGLGSFLKKVPNVSVYDHLKDDLLNILKSREDISTALELFNDSEIIDFYTMLKNNEFNFTPGSLCYCNPRDFWENLVDIGRGHLLNHPSINPFTSINIFIDIFKSMNKKNTTLLFHAIQHTLADLIHTLNDFEAVFKLLDKEQRVILFNCLRSKVSSIISCDDDYKIASNYLSAEQCAELSFLVKQERPSAYDKAPRHYTGFWRDCNTLTSAREEGVHPKM